MNKIIVDKENKIEFNDNIIDLDIKVNELEIIIKGKVLINEFNIKENENLNLKLTIKPNSTLIYNRFMKHSKMNNCVTINQENNSNITFNYSLIATDKCNLKIDSVLTGDNNTTSVRVRAVSEDDGKCTIDGNAKIKEKIKNNELLESLRILTLNNEDNIITPNLLVSSNEVAANHAATISSIDKNYLFYLNSKGISDDSAIKLITEGFLLSNLDISESVREQIKNII